jgi:hypothetical protein
MATPADTDRRKGFGTNWGASLIRFHLQNANMAEDDRADLSALADSLEATDGQRADVFRFARDFARTSGDSPSCDCVNCRAYRAVRDEDGL